jgi:NTP pyrophosphatase (non-canonical NTP hydrolase)
MNIDNIMRLSAKWDAPVLVRHTKLVEECGEFAEAVLAKLGHLPHKTMKEPAMGEAADVIICVIDTVRELYLTMSDDDFKIFLQEQLDLKSKKWEDVLIKPQEV